MKLIVQLNGLLIHSLIQLVEKAEQARFCFINY